MSPAPRRQGVLPAPCSDRRGSLSLRPPSSACFENSTTLIDSPASEAVRIERDDGQVPRADPPRALLKRLDPVELARGGIPVVTT